MSKRVISVVLLVFILFSFTTAIASENKQAFSNVITYSIMPADENGKLNLEKEISRGEMAQFVINAMGLSDIKYNGLEEDFADVAKEHASYNAVMLARSFGVVEGNGDGTYAPDRRISYAEALKMTVILLGYDPIAQARGAWQNGYLIVANTLGLTEGINCMLNEYAPASDIALILEKAMDIPIMCQTGFGSKVEYIVMDGSAGTELKTLKDNFE